VNAVLPGFTVTPMTDVVPDKVKDVVTSMIPLRRMGQPEGMPKQVQENRYLVIATVFLKFLLYIIKLYIDLYMLFCALF